MPDIQIGGLVSFTTIDYPGKLAAVIFLVGCPLRCAYCSNPHLIMSGNGEYDPDKVFDWIKSRVGKLEAIVFSGGEALMQGNTTIEYIKKVKNLGFFVGLHTNGFYPELLKQVEQYVDWIGLDYKATQSKYKSLVGNDIAFQRMSESLDFWIQTGKPLEVRTTCDPRFISVSDLLEIATDLHKRGVKSIAIQKYIPHFETDDNTTTEAERNQFFNDSKLKSQINVLFDSVSWRE